MKLIKIICATCGKTFFRSVGRVNEVKKFGWKQYCSRECQGQAKWKRITKVCANPNCRKAVSHKLSEFKKSKSGRIFCSRSCAVSVNNSEFPKRKRRVKKCNYCNKEFTGKGKEYCSKKCKDKAQIIPKEEISKQIKEFYKRNKRIPLKREFPHYDAVRARFGTWNKAIKAVGFEPNPVKFAKRQTAKDGHVCDSFAEKIIDDWLYSKNIKHQRNTIYPNSSYTVDFLINGKFVEFLGLSGELKEYDKNTKLKERLAKKYNIKLIKIYPKDLFPVNHLSRIIKI